MGNRSSSEDNGGDREGRSPPLFSYDAHDEAGIDDARAAAAEQARQHFFSGQPETCGDQVDAVFGFDKISAQALTTSCFVSPATLLALRAFMLVYAATVLGWYWYGLKNPVSMAVSLTSWTQLLTVVYLIFAIALTAKHLCGSGNNGNAGAGVLADSVVMRVTFMLFEIAFTWSLVGVIMYWITVFPVTHTGHNPASTTELLSTIHLHGACLAFCAVDLFIGRVKFEFAHYVISAVLALTYCAINALYLHPHTTALSAVKWDSFTAVLIIFGAVFGVLVSFVLTVMLTTARDVCHAQSDRNQPIIIPASLEDGFGVKKQPQQQQGDGESAFQGLSFSI